MSALRNYFASAAGGGGNGSSSASEPNQQYDGGEIIKFEGRNLKLTKLIAEGGFSYVYFGDFGGQIVAVKKVLTPDKPSATSLAAEIELLSQLNHRNIVKLLGTKTSPVENYIIMEYCSALPLPLPANNSAPIPTSDGIVNSLSQSSTTSGLIGNVFKQCCSAVEYLHNLSIAHRDIKHENFLVGSDGFIKLIDFGSATRQFIYPKIEWNSVQRGIIEEEISSKTTPMYRSPEQVDLWLNYPIDTRVDMWSLGCLLYLLTYGTHPFPDSSKLAIINAKYTIKSMDEDNTYNVIIRGLLQPNPSDRLNFEGIFKYLAEIPISKVEFRKPTVTSIPEILQQRRDESGSGSSSLFKSLRGGAESLFKNIKQNIQEAADTYYASGPPPKGAGNGNGSVVPGANASVPEPKLPPKPQVNLRQNEEFIPPRRPSIETRQPDLINPSAPPRPPKPPHSNSPKHIPDITPEAKQSTQPTSNVDLLLDFGESFDKPFVEPPPPLPPHKATNPTPTHSTTQNNVDLLADLFGATTTTTATTTTSNAPGRSNKPMGMAQPNFDLFGGIEFQQVQDSSVLIPEVKVDYQQKIGIRLGSSNKSAAGGNPNKKSSLLDDLDLFGNSSNTTATNSSSTTTTSIPTSSSFGSLGQLRPEPVMHKNVSTPNLTDLLINSKDIKPNIPPTSQDQNYRPNYSRTAFEDPKDKDEQPKTTNLNDMFGEFLKHEGFTSSNSNKTQTIGELRKEELIKSGANPINLKVNAWKEGKTKNIRALLSSLHTITWEECTWGEISMSQMITPAQVKKAYRKACLAIHPDKLVGSEYEELAKAIFMELNEAWSGFEEV